MACPACAMRSAESRLNAYVETVEKMESIFRRADEHANEWFDALGEDDKAAYRDGDLECTVWDPTIKLLLDLKPSLDETYVVEWSSYGSGRDRAWHFVHDHRDHKRIVRALMAS